MVVMMMMIMVVIVIMVVVVMVMLMVVIMSLVSSFRVFFKCQLRQCSVLKTSDELVQLFDCDCFQRRWEYGFLSVLLSNTDELWSIHFNFNELGEPIEMLVFRLH